MDLWLNENDHWTRIICSRSSKLYFTIIQASLSSKLAHKCYGKWCHAVIGCVVTTLCKRMPQTPCGLLSVGNVNTHKLVRKENFTSPVFTIVIVVYWICIPLIQIIEFIASFLKVREDLHDQFCLLF